MLEVNKIYQGDCLEVLKTLPYESIDAIITDPPAGIEFMGKEWDSFKQGKQNAKWQIAGKNSLEGFEGKNDWFSQLRPAFRGTTQQERDNFIQFMTEVMSECKRVLKSGGHAVVWALPRTSHWTTMAIENAGFEIRDVIHHIFNTGFPKSLNIGKAVDKKLGNEREVIGEGKRGSNGVTEGKTFGGVVGGYNYARSFKIEKGTSQFEGFGTALKPACEHWILARKPLSEKTIVEQVLKNGCGGLDIDGCRIPVKNDRDMDGMKVGFKGSVYKSFMEGQGRDLNKENPTQQNTESNSLGRFPANVIVQDDALNDGIISKNFRPNCEGKNYKSSFDGHIYSKYNNKKYVFSAPKDMGSKSRYFDIDLWAEKKGILQIPKPSKSEKNKGCEELEEKYMDESREIGSIGGSNPINRGAENPRKNHHPTVKSIALMSWLIKLVSKEGDTILDCFAGSGTTLVASKILNRNFIGIERENEYIKIAEARIKPYLEQSKLFPKEA